MELGEIDSLNSQSLTDVQNESSDSPNINHYIIWSRRNYKLVLCIWMINDVNIIDSGNLIAGQNFLILCLLYCSGLIFIGMPIVYLSVLMAQYTNLNTISMWKVFPLLRGMGVVMAYLSFLKLIYCIVVSSWYLQYTFYATHEIPPWESCSGRDSTKCLVKKINVTAYQYCLELFHLYNGLDCNLTSATYYAYDDIVGSETQTKNWPNCLANWKTQLCNLIVIVLIYLLVLKKEKFLRISLITSFVYVAGSFFILYCVALASEGSWSGVSDILLSKNTITTEVCLDILRCSILSVGAGFGVLNYLTKESPFRSPANMNAILASVLCMSFGVLVSIMLFNISSAMAYYHGENFVVIREHYLNIPFYLPLGRTPESISYLGDTVAWRFLWFSAIFVNLCQMQFILTMYLSDLLIECFSCARRHPSIILTFFSLSLVGICSIFVCSDLIFALKETIEDLQLYIICLHLMAFAWLYQYRKVCDDILFMLGIKTSYFWKTTWVLSPVLMIILLYFDISNFVIDFAKLGFFIVSLHVNVDVLIYAILLFVPFLFCIIVALVQVWIYSKNRNIRSIFLDFSDWGPSDLLLRKSRHMFVAEIMTREFLYRQVRIRNANNSANRGMQNMNAVSSDVNSCSD